MEPTAGFDAATVAMTTAAPSAPADPSGEGRFLPGTLVAGRYRIISLLGSGGMGEVYRATDLTLAHPVALKFLSDAGPNTERMLGLFHNEVRVARQVSHPNVCRVYDVGEADGTPYISMEYVDGEDLASLLRRIGRLPAERALLVGRKICAGLAAAHEKGVIHRDLKPANIMLDRRGNVVLMDFGLSAIADQLQGPESRSGTPAYMAPEQLRGENVTAKSDIYALGLVLYELFTGRRAYQADTLPELLRLQESARMAAISSVAPDIDPSVETVIRRCLEPDAAKRPATALAVAASLPGGDPLAAALAAGDTPSPELVAASGVTEGLPLRHSVPLALGLIAAIFAVPFVRNGVELHSIVPLELSPDSLAVKIREHAAAFGHTELPADRKYNLHWAPEIIGAARRQVKTPEEKRRFFEAEPPIVLGYRESPTLLIAPPDGDVTATNPAPLVSGMIEAWVNSKGQLRRFMAVPDQANVGSAPSDIDPEAIARATGFDLAAWQETPPRWTPLYAFDRIRAWKGRHPSLPFEITVQAAAWRGRITHVEVIWPWSQPDRLPNASRRSFGAFMRSATARVVSILVFLFSAFLAARNFRLGRGDRRGATRIAFATLILSAATWALSAHWIPDATLIDILIRNAEQWLSSALLIWVLYIALEPAVRSRWPHSIVSWSRVLAGRWNDPLVGSHVLYGALLGLVIVGGFAALQWFNAATGGLSPTTSPEAGTSARFWLASLITRAVDAMQIGLVAVFALFCLRALFRRDWLASAVAAAIFTALEADVWREGIVTVTFFFVVFTLLVFVLLRLGLVPTMVAVLFVNALLETPGPRNLSQFWEWQVIATPLLIAAIVLWAFMATSGDRLLATGGSDGAS